MYTYGCGENDRPFPQSSHIVIYRGITFRRRLPLISLNAASSGSLALSYRAVYMQQLMALEELPWRTLCVLNLISHWLCNDRGVIRGYGEFLWKKKPKRRRGIVCVVSVRKNENEERDENRLNNIILVFLFIIISFCETRGVYKGMPRYLSVSSSHTVFLYTTNPISKTRRFNMANNNFKGSIINGPLAESVNDFFSFHLVIVGVCLTTFTNHITRFPITLYVCVCVWVLARTGLRHRYIRMSRFPFLLLLLLLLLLWFIMWSHNIVSGSCSLLYCLQLQNLCRRFGWTK